MMIQAVPSRYNVFIGLSQGRRLAYNAYSGALSLLDAKDLEALDKIEQQKSFDAADPVSAELARLGLVIPAECDELELLEEEYKRVRFDTSNPVLTIMTTTSCNFGCDYCFQGEDKPHAVLGKKVQSAIVDWIKTMAGTISGFGVCWYGGEPLLKADVIEDLSKRFIETAKEMKIGYDASIVTNGWYLDGKMAKLLRSLAVTWAQVTLDGAQTDHDGRRHLLGGQPTFDRIINNLVEAVDTNSLKIAIRVNIDARNREGIIGLLDQLAARGLGNRNNFGVYFAPVEAITDGCHSVADVTMSKGEYGELEAELYRHALRNRLCGLPLPARFHGNCAAIKPRGVVITPSGDIHKCWDTISTPNYRVGTIFEPEKLIDDRLHQKWMEWTPFKNDTCRNCKILPTCTGSCAYKFIHATHTRGEAAVLPCPPWKYNLARRLVTVAEGKGVITKGDYAEDTFSLKPTDLCTDDFRGGDALPEHMLELIAGRQASHPRLQVVS